MATPSNISASAPSSRISALQVVNAIALGLVSLIGGPIVLFISVMASDACPPDGEASYWACSVTGQQVIAWVVPAGTLLAWIVFLAGPWLARRFGGSAGLWRLAAWAALAATWVLSVALASPPA